MLSEDFRNEMRRIGQAWYDNGYTEGLTGKEYSGKTFIGYYGWCDGRDKRNARVED